MNITAPIRYLARHMPDTMAVIDGDHLRLTYAQLDRAIDVAAHHVLRLGLRPGDIVALGLVSRSEVPFLVLLLALARLGVTSAEPSLPPEHVRLAFHYGTTAPPGHVRFDESWMAAAFTDAAIAPAPMHGDETALLRLFASSGTTGTPKHIPVSHALMARRVYSRFLSQGGGPRTRMVGLGLGIMPGFISLLMTLWQGGTLVIFNPASVVADIGRFGVEVLVASTASLKRVVDLRPEGAGPVPGLQLISIGGSRLPAGLRQLALARLCPHIETTLGAAEVARIACARVEALDTRPGAAGFISPDVEVQAIDAEGNPLPEGEEGVLRVRSPCVADGYFADRAATAESFRDGWFYPGDIGAVWPDGMLSLSGRASEVINIGGDKFDPARIEQVLDRVPQVVESAVFAVPDETGSPELCAALVVSAPVDTAELNAICARYLPRMSFATILEVDALPRNEAGKVQRDRLMALVAALDRADEA
ncbi:MAG: AMP-binding protein [Proteobacteria bacterium]|nr:AMP-binding protein [Pseudomonadota bacterium]